MKELNNVISTDRVNFEFSTYYQSVPINVLGYELFLSSNFKKFKNEFDDFNRKKTENLHLKISEHLELDINNNALFSCFLGDKTDEKIASNLVKTSLMKNYDEAFNLIKSFNSSLFNIDLVEVLSIINTSLGKAFFDNPKVLENTDEKFEFKKDKDFHVFKEFRKLKKIGFHGIECFHPTYTKNEVDLYKNMALATGLLTSEETSFRKYNSNEFKTTYSKNKVFDWYDIKNHSIDGKLAK